MILGHEIAGMVARVGAEVETVQAGQRVAVNPSRPCGACRYCAEGKQQLRIALGCTGGYHRSIVLAEELARRVSSLPGAAVTVIHRELPR